MKKRGLKRRKNKQNKKGQIEAGWQFFFSLIFVVLILSMMLWFVARQADGDLIQTQIIAKEACLLATSARPGSMIEIEHVKNLIIEKKDGGIVVKKSEYDPGYFYPCYLTDIAFTKKDNRTYIKK